MKHIKYIPLSLFSILAIKGIISGLNLEGVASLLVLGSAAFLYEKYSHDQQIEALKKDTESQLNAMKEELKSLELIKSKVTSMQLQGMTPVAPTPRTQNRF